MNNKHIKWLIWIVIMTSILIGVSIVALCIGPASIPVKKIFSILIKGGDTVEYNILINIRLPRIILGFAVGGALSISGVILQGMFRNPLVEPYTIGISGGAALGVCLNIILKFHNTISAITLPVSGFLGAVLTVFFVYSLSMKKSILKIQGLLLTGVMVSFISSALIMFIMAISRAEDLHGIIFWIMGYLEEPNSVLIYSMLLISIAGLCISYFFCMDLNAFSIGEEEAMHLGINTEKTKRLLFLLASVLTGFSVSIVGIIGFIGLVVPHFVRMFIGSDHRILLICSFLCGSSFLILCDTLARTIISPMELPVGVITGILGGTLFVYALTKKQIRMGGN